MNFYSSNRYNLVIDILISIYVAKAKSSINKNLVVGDGRERRGWKRERERGGGGGEGGGGDGREAEQLHKVK